MSTDMQQAKEDGATVAIYYESRLAKLRLKDDDLALLDEEVDELAEDEEESRRPSSKAAGRRWRKWSAPRRALPAWRPTWWRTLKSGARPRTARPWWWP